MYYFHDIDGCFEPSIGENGITEPQFRNGLTSAALAAAELKEQFYSGQLPFLRLAHARDDLEPLADIAQRYREEFDTVLVLGTGGSSLGGRTCAALSRPGGPAIQFVENVDPETISCLLNGLDPARTGVIVISKSGRTAETIAQFLVVLGWLRASDGALNQITVVTEPTDSPLRRLAEREGFLILDHDPEVGGRFSVLSVVGMLPALLAGLDAKSIRAGAASVLDDFLGQQDPIQTAPCQGAALNASMTWNRGVFQTVLMPYVDRLVPFGDWFRQLWAESLGKAGTGTTPVTALGTVDQHSQLQLYLAGPRDKLVTIIGVDTAGAGPAMDAELVGEDPELAYLAGKNIGDLMAAELDATVKALGANGRPVRVVTLPDLDETTLGALFMHFMLETLITAHLIGVDPLTQPAVEEIKTATRESLSL